MKNMAKSGVRRALSILLTLVMLLQCLPAGSLAAGEAQNDSTFMGFSNWTITDGSWNVGTGVTGNGAQITPKGNGAVLRSDPMSVTSGEKLRAGMWVKIPTGGKAALYLLTYTDAAAKKSAGDSILLDSETAGADFVELAADVTVPANVQAVRLQLSTGASGTYIADDAYIRAYTDLPEFVGVMGDGYGVEGQWSLFYPLVYAEGDWAEQKDMTRDPSGFNYAQIVADGKEDKGAVRFIRANVYEHIGIAIGSNLVVGEEYTVKMWVKGNAVQTYGGLQIYGHNDPVIATFGSEGTCPDPNKWYEITLPITATRNHLYIFMNGGAYACDVLMDNVQVLDSEGNDMLGGCGSFAGDGTVTLGSSNRVLNSGFEDTEFSYLPLADFNGSFEGASQEDGDLDWTLNAESTDEMKIVVDDDGKHLQLTKAGSGSLLQGPAVELIPGSTYQIAMDLKTTGTVAVGGVYCDASGNEVGYWVPDILCEANDWSRIEGFLTVPADAASFRIRMQFSGTAGDTMAVDNVAIHPCEVAEPETPPEETDPEFTMDAAALDASQACNAYGGSSADYWMPMYPTGSPDSGTWAAWDITHYGEIAADGKNDPGSLHLVSIPGKNTGVAINAGMTAGQQYTLTFWAKGTSNSGRVLSMYANGDQVIIAESAELTADWSQYAVTFTATLSQLNILAADWGNTGIYLDNITLTDASGNDLLAGKGDFYTEGTASDPEPEQPSVTMVPITLDTSKVSGAYEAYQGEWTAMYPTGSPDSGTWGAWDAAHYGEVAADGKNDPGSLHLVSVPGKNTGVAINAGMTAGQQYTLTFWAKGTSNSGRVLSMYANGDQVIIAEAAKLTADWSQYAVTFTATLSQLNILAADWGNTSIYLDNITLTDASGNDLLAGCGDFCEEGTASGEEPEETKPAMKTDPSALDDTLKCNAYDGSSADHWMPMYPTGTPDSGTWAAWDENHYGEISEDGKNDPGSLHLISAPGKNTGVAINAGMAVGQQYTLTLWAKGTSNSGRVLSMYANGDQVIIAESAKLTADWSRYSVTFTATISQLNILAADWGNTEIYIDNMTLKDSAGNDLLAGKGDFCVEDPNAPGPEETEPEATEPETTEPVETEPVLLDTENFASHGVAPGLYWSTFYPTGAPDGGTWAAWDSASHYGEIVSEGYKDTGALHLKSNSGKNVAVAINAAMTPGQQYTLGLWVKGTSNSGKVLGMYGNGDGVIIGASENLASDWTYYEMTFTANLGQLNIIVSDWGVTDLYIDNVTLKDASGTDLLQYRGDFCVRTPGEPHPDGSVNLMEGGDFEDAAALYIPGWIIEGTAVMDGDTLSLKKGTVMYSLRYQVEEGQILYARYSADGGVMAVEMGSHDQTVSTVEVGQEGLLFSVPSGAEWIRVYYGAMDKPAAVSLIELIDKGDPANLDFELKDPNNAMPMNWTTWTAVNDPNMSADRANGVYTVMHQEGTGVEGTNSLYILLNQDVAENRSGNMLTAVVDSIKVEVEPNTTYSFSFWAKMDADNGCIYPSVRCFKEDGSADGATVWMNGAFVTDTSGQWKQYKTTYSTGADTKYIAFRIETKASNAGAQFWVDRITYEALGSSLDTNLDFELGEQDQIPLNWTTYERNYTTNEEGAFGNYKATWQPNVSVDGSAALKVQKLNNAATELYVCSNMIPVKPGASYYFSYDAATLQASSSDQILIMLRQKTANGDNVSDETKAFYWPTNAYATGHFNWSEFGAIFETAEDCAYIQVMFCIRSSYGYTAYIDNVSLTETAKLEDPNLDFEYAVGKIPLNWSFNGVLAKSSMEVCSENVYSGDQALRVLRENGELDCSFVYAEKMIPVTAGDKIEVVAHISSRNAVSGHFSMCFFGYGDTTIDTTKMVNSMYGQERITNSGDQWSQWDTYEMVYTVPKGVNYIQLCLRIGGTCNDVLIDDITVYNYTKNDNVIYQEDFKDPSVTTGLPGGWEKGEITGTGEAKVNGQMSLTGNEGSNVEIFTKLYSLKTDYVYTLTANVFTTGTATGQLIMEAVNWNGTVAGQSVVLDINSGAVDAELKANFESLSAVYYRLILRKTGGNGSVCIKNVSLQQSGEPYNGITWAGKWLTHPDETARISESPHPFTERHYFTRTEINLDKPIETAQMQITADDKFTLYINGMQVYEETRTGDTWDLPVTVDITEYLTQGKNVIAVDMFNNIYLYGLLFDGIVKMEDESSLRFYSTADTMMAAECLSDEIIPTRNPLWTEEDQMNWMQVDYDISTCPLWVHADEFASIGGGGWGELDFDPTEYSDYKIFSNEFTFPEEDITAGDTVKVTAQVMLEKELPTTNSFQVNFWKRNTTSRVCSGVLTVANGKTTDDWPIGEEFTAEFELQIPMFLAEGAYTVQLESTVSVVSDYFINNKVGYIDVVQIERELTTTSSVEMVNGKATMIVNGEMKAPLWYARPERPSLFEEDTVVSFGEVGVDTIVSYIFLNNTYGDVWTKEGFVPDLVDSMMLDTLAGNPEAQLIIALDFNAPDWWKEENPGELAALSGTAVSNTNASFASEKWKEESGAIMLAAIDHMMSQPYANNIIGFKVTGGYTLEWNWWASSGIYTDVGDFSECGINAFRQWLTQKYGTDEALQEAYGNDKITLANAMPPSKEMRADDYLDSVISIQDHPEFMDYELYMAEIKADTIEYFCKLVNEHIEDRLMVGTYGGYFYMGGGYEFSSAVANVYFQRMLQSEHIDFIKSPWMYGMRETGDSAQFMGPADSLDLYGKLWIIEDDSRMNLKEMAEGQDGRAAVGWTRNYQQSVEQLKRNFSYILSKGMGVSFYNLMWNFSHDDQYYGAIGQMYEEMTLSLGLTNESVAEVAIFVDGESQMLIPWESEFLNNTLYQSVYQEQLEELGHMGASYDMYLLDDLADGLVPEHKINIFLGTTYMTEKEREAVKALQKNGNILVWQFTDGIADGEKTELALMEDLIGMDLSIISTKRKQIGTARIINNEHWLTEGMNLEQPYGVKSYSTISPIIAVTDRSATPLAYHSTTSATDGTPAGQVALAVKDMGDWTCIYSAVPNMPQIMLRNMLEKVGGHIYTESGSDVIYANNNYVALHSNFAGERTIRLPGNYTVYDVFNRKIISTNTDSFTITLSGKETRLFRITDPETVQVYIGQNAGGTVSNKGLTELKPGDSLSFTVEAAEGYRLSYLLLDGHRVFLEGNSYTFEDIQESHTVLAHFSPSYGNEDEPVDATPDPIPEPRSGWLIPVLIGSGAALLVLIAAIAVIAVRKRKKQ